METMALGDSRVATLESTAGAFAAAIREAVGCDVVYVFGMEKSRSMLVEVGKDGVGDGYAMPIVHLGQGLTGLAFLSCRFQATDDYPALPYRRVRGVMLGIRSLFAVPLVCNGHAYAAVMCVSRTPAAFELREAELVRRVASVPVDPVETIEILAEIRFQHKRYYALQKLLRSNTERLPLESACASVSEIVADFVGADYVVVGRRTVEGMTTYHGAYGSATGAWSLGTRDYAPLAIDLESAVESGETVVVDLSTIADDDASFALSKAEGAKTLVIVPIVARGRRIGTLIVGWRIALVPPQRVLDALAIFAAQASVAVTDEWRRDDAAVRADLDVARATNRSAATDLRAAIANDGLQVVYQPIFDLRTGRIVECEALSRWPGAPGPFSDPELFVRLAEEYGTIGLLTDRVVYRAIRDIEAMPAGVRIAINTSMINLLQFEFAKRLLRIFTAAGVAPNRFALELTETASIVDRELGSEAVAELARAGVEIGIDDFGEGYSALSYLKMFPATTIKIHKRYIRDFQNDPYDEAIVRSVIDLAHRIEMQVVAEGVEDAAMIAALRAIGCDRVQGYGCARPMPIDELRALFESPQASIANVC